MNEALVTGVGVSVLGLLGLFALSRASGGAKRSTSPPTSTPGPEPRRDSQPVRSQSHQVPQGRQEEERPTLADVKRVSWAIVTVFETGRPEGRYDAFAVLADSAGISYGIKQATDRSGTLDAIVREYIQAGGRYASQLQAFMPRLANDETTRVSTDPNAWPSWMHELKRVLVAAGQDPVMRRAQQSVIDRIYWHPAVAIVRELGLRTPLAYAVIFDTFIHSGPRGVGWMRRRFAAKPPSEGGDERIWLRDYVNARRRWLATHDKTALHATVYRMDLFIKLIREGNWALRTPFTIDRPRATIR